MSSFKRPVEPYVVPLADTERASYQRLRIPAAHPAGQAAPALA